MDVRIELRRSDGASLAMGDGTDWHLPVPDIEGMARLNLTLSTSPRVLADGSALVSKRVDEADRTVRAEYGGRDNAAARAQAVAFFNPKHSFEMHVEAMGRRRWCAGELEAFECPFQHERMATEFTFTLLCPDPFWRSEDRNEHPFGDASPMFGFPYVSHARETLPGDVRRPVGSLASKSVYDGVNTVWNSGDVAAPYLVRIDALGEIVNPCISKGGKRVCVQATLTAAQTLLIDFEGRMASVTVDGRNVIHRCTRDSSFTGMRMGTGPNPFAFSCDNPANRSLARVSVLFNKRYLGV